MKFTSCSCRRKEQAHGEGLSVHLMGFCLARVNCALVLEKQTGELQSKLLQDLS